ncbi:histidinol-phosphatase [Selenomonas ruminis]|uniref:Histidinol-phosphatase n=1 Tax=Selenomonas ruminis TaxID=2593411 RepID=A0A5D6WAC2_9FIRM|nr:histidinol-phosphatase [Selenomonas sp. mPRGC5]TYZ23935.1 histidinol-phosphatase [Selenomonas sp. mPRGC5]
MKIDYHMHFEKGSYDKTWVEGFFRAANERGIAEIGISEHSHTFPEFKELYYEDLILDDSAMGSFQQQWLKSNKFKYTLDDYFRFMAELRKEHTVRTGIEVCNFQDQEKVKDILKDYDFDYVIGSVHFLHGWAYDCSEIIAEWEKHPLEDIYEWYTEEAEKLAASGLYDVLGHPFNIRLFKFLPDFDVTPYLERVAKAMKKANMIVDVNTGTFYRYPIAEITPYPEFMKIAAKYDLPVITTSDAHKPEDCGAYNQQAVDYVKQFGYTTTLQLAGRKRKVIELG